LIGLGFLFLGFFDRLGVIIFLRLFFWLFNDLGLIVIFGIGRSALGLCSIVLGGVGVLRSINSICWLFFFIDRGFGSWLGIVLRLGLLLGNVLVGVGFGGIVLAIFAGTCISVAFWSVFGIYIIYIFTFLFRSVRSFGCGFNDVRVLADSRLVVIFLRSFVLIFLELCFPIVLGLGDLTHGGNDRSDQDGFEIERIHVLEKQMNVTIIQTASG
jgi:hypothetical protein